MLTEEKAKENTTIEFLQIGVDIYNGYKISKDGLSREEDTTVMVGMNEERRNYTTGAKLREAILGQTSEAKND